MQNSSGLKMLLFAAVCFLSTSSLFAQTPTTRLIGDWTISKWEYLKNKPDNYISLENQAKNKIISFQQDNKVKTTQTVAGKKEVIGSGTYKVSDDGKFLFQDNQQYEIIGFENDEFAIKVSPDLIMHFSRVVLAH